MRNIIRFFAIIRVAFWFSGISLGLWSIGLATVLLILCSGIVGIGWLFAGAALNWELIVGAGIALLLAIFWLSSSWMSQRILFDLMLTRILKRHHRPGIQSFKIRSLNLCVIIGRRLGPELYHLDTQVRIEEDELSTAILFDMLLHASIVNSNLQESRTAENSVNLHCPNLRRLGV